MWTGRCLAERKRGGQCTRESVDAYWTWEFQGERFTDGPSWIEVCGNHAQDAMTGMVSGLPLPRGANRPAHYYKRGSVNA